MEGRPTASPQVVEVATSEVGKPSARLVKDKEWWKRGAQMGGFPTSGGVVEYRGKMYVTRSGGAGFVRFVIPAGEGAVDFPDGIKFGNTDGIRWVNIACSSLTRRLFREVDGLWRGAKVSVGHMHLTGWDVGKVNLAYAGPSPEQALALGFKGDQYMGWYAAADPAEVEIMSVTVTERPLSA